MSLKCKAHGKINSHHLLYWWLLHNLAKQVNAALFIYDGHSKDRSL